MRLRMRIFETVFKVPKKAKISDVYCGTSQWAQKLPKIFVTSINKNLSLKISRENGGKKRIAADRTLRHISYLAHLNHSQNYYITLS